MALAGPSRIVPLPSRERIESTYEQDLRRMLDHLSLEERDELQASLKRRISAGGHLSDYDVALNDLIQQARELDALDEDRMLAERIAVEEDSDVAVDQVQASTAQPEPSPGPNLGKKKRQRTKRKSRAGKTAQDSAPSSLPDPIQEREEQYPPLPAAWWAIGLPSSSQKGKEIEREVNRQHGVPDAPVDLCKPVIPSSGPRPVFGSLPSGPVPANIVVAVAPRAEKAERRIVQSESGPKNAAAAATARATKVNRPTAQDSAPSLLPHPIQEREEQFPPLPASRWASGPPSSSRKGKETEREVNRQHGVPDAPVDLCKPVIPSSGPRPVFGSLPSESGPTNVAVAPRATKVKRPTGHDCVICQDPIYDIEIQAPCGHHYDVACVTDLFKSATRDETLFPPRCCKQIIPFTQVRSHLSQSLAATFQEKEVEFGTLKRVYCSSPTCSRFLGSLLEDGSPARAYACPCSKKTCGKCREQHDTSVNRVHVCRPDATATGVLELGRASGWARCPGCSQMIELDVGCFHMTCRCKTEFCYLCRARWKTCPCDQWDEQRLLSAAEQRVDARLGAGRGQGVQHDVAPQQQQRRDPALVGNPFALLSDDHRPVHPTPTAPTRSGGPPERQRPGRFGDPRSGSASIPDFVPNMNAIRARMVLEMMERLRVDHDCDHIRWRYQDDGGHCDNCGDYLPLYLFHCEDCEMWACNRCRRNRL